jgi:hypothetical protein
MTGLREARRPAMWTADTRRPDDRPAAARRRRRAAVRGGHRTQAMSAIPASAGPRPVHLSGRQGTDPERPGQPPHPARAPSATSPTGVEGVERERPR